MSSISAQRGPCWFQHFPVLEKLTLGDPLRTVVVDVGGGVGHDLVALGDEYAALQRRMIVQDIPVVVKDVKDPRIEPMEHDFFSPQPVKDATTYLLGRALHDWPDMQAEKILGSIREGMSEDSILLVWENVLPEANVPQLSAATDRIMMARLSSLEQTSEQYRTLLEKSGFELVKAWGSDVAEPESG